MKQDDSSRRIDVEKLAATYLSQVSYNDVMSVEARHPMESSLFSGSSDSTHPFQWVMVSDWNDLAYQELLSMKNRYSRDLVKLEEEVKGLSESQESADKYEPFKIFVQEYVKFLSLSKSDFAVLSKNKCYMLMHLIKSFMDRLGNSLSSDNYVKQLISLGDLSQIPELQQRMVIKVLSTNPSGRSESAFIDSARQSEWVRLDDWHDLAYRELKAIRRAYLPQLLKAYERVCGMWSESPDLCTKYLAVRIFLLEYCKLLTMSRTNIVGLSKGECYVFMMLIKIQLWKQVRPAGRHQIPEIQDEVDIRVDFVDRISLRKSASSDPVHAILSDWDVQAYEELERLRNLYSSQLDKIFKMVYGRWSQSSQPENCCDATIDAIGRVLNFLAMSRADVFDLSEEGFLDSMRLFKSVVRPPVISNPDQPMNNQGNQSFRCKASMNSSQDRFTNPYDQLYEELRLMRKKYMPVLLKAYHKLSQSSLPKHQKVTDSIYKCFRVLEMPRSNMAVVPNGCQENWVKFVELVVGRCRLYLLSPASRCSANMQSRFGYREVRNLIERD